MLYNITFSPTGGTKKVADILAKELADKAENIDLTCACTDFSIYKLKKDDLAVIAFPSFGGRAPAVAAERLKLIRADSAPAVLICVYGNRAYEDTLAEMRDAAQAAGFKVAAAIAAVAEHSIARAYGAGRPDAEDEKQLKSFAQKIKERLASGDDFVLKISGSGPYKKAGNAGLLPKTTKDCVNCKKCAELCPTGAISKTDINKIDKSKCISCMRCVSVCPKHAKQISKIMAGLVSLFLKKACSARKDNELF